MIRFAQFLYATSPWVMLAGWSYGRYEILAAGLAMAGWSGWIRGGQNLADDL